MELFEKKMPNFKEFEESLDEGFLKNAALGAMMTGATLSGNAANSNKDVKSDNVDKSNKITMSTKDKKVADNNINLGWVLDSTVVDTIVQKTIEKGPTEIKSVGLDLGQGFVSGGYILDDEAKQEINNLFSQLATEGYIVNSLSVESSTDKTPINQNSEILSNAGIKTNQDLSIARSKSIIDYLSDNNLVSDVNKDSIDVINLAEQGKVDDPTTRYVKFVVCAVKADEEAAAEQNVDIKTTYYLSKEKSTDGKKIKRKFRKLFKITPIKTFNEFKKYGKAVNCAIDFKK